MLSTLIVPLAMKIFDTVVQQSKSKTVVANTGLLAVLPTALAYLQPILTEKEFAITSAVMLIVVTIINILLRNLTNVAVADKTKLLD